MTLKDARELVGLTQTGLDRKAGLQPGTTHDVESGRNANPTYSVVARLVRALQMAGLKGATAEGLFPVPEQTDRKEAS